MKSVLIRLLALTPIPIVIVLVVWAGKRPMPPPLVLKKHGHSRSGPSAAVKLPSTMKSGWKLQGKVEQYDKKTLFDRINGAAPAYIRAGYAYSLGAEFRKPDSMKESVVADVYDMGTVAQGLGMYATERDSSYTFIPVGQEGYLASGSLNFWKGRFYVKLAGFEDNETMNKALRDLAEGLAKALPLEDKDKVLAPLALLPKEDRLPNADGYSHPPLADVEGLARVFYTGYRAGEGSYRVFIARCKDPSEASKRLGQVKAYFARDGAKIEESADGETKIVMVSGDATTLVVQRGALLAGAVDLTEATLVPAARAKVLVVAKAEGSPK